MTDDFRDFVKFDGFAGQVWYHQMIRDKRILRRAREFTPERLFEKGEQGVWYDPSDMSTMFQDIAGTVPVAAVEQPVGRILDKSGRGNHATQATTTKRPIYSRRVNLLTKTEAFGDAVWSKNASTISANTAETLDPLGGNSACKLSESATKSGHYIDVASPGVTGLVVGQSYTRSLYVKSAGRRWVVFNIWDGASRMTWFDVENGVVGTNAAGSVATIQSAGNGWYRCSVTRMVPRGSIAIGTETQLGDGLSASFVGDVTKGIYIWGASLAPADQASLPYQRVNTATDYDADPSKFPADLRADGVDDSLTSSTGGGGTTGFFFSAAIRPQGSAGTARTLFSDAGTNTGYIVRLNASNQLEFAAGNGTAYTTIATVGTMAVNATDVVQAWDDGTTLNVKIGSGPTASIARPVVSAGTAGYTLYQNNGVATGYFNGRSYGEIYRKDSGLTQSQREAVAVYQRKQARIA
jgi:hypothetical protein